MKTSRFARFAWCVLGYNLLVILWGAYVRASGSGAGCGAHWPLCNGEVVPRAPALQTMVEFTHRASSGVALLLVLGLLIWALRGLRPPHPARRAAVWSFVFIVIEALLGAGLVLFELVAHNASLTRAVSMALHLVNTFLLIGALSLTAWFAAGQPRLDLRGRGGLSLLLGAGLFLTLLVGATGAVTALGDTLFPAGSLAQGLADDFAPAAHFLLRLRVVHPLLAVASAGYLVTVAVVIHAREPAGPARPLAKALAGVVALQVLVGAVNLALLAPIWAQLVHLLLADAVWIIQVLLAAAVLAAPAPVPPARPRLAATPG